MSAAIEWGSTADERAASYHCEEFVPDAALAVYRAIDINAPVTVVYRWLCQLRVAPYSYDLLDNLGRRSPRELTPGANELEEGQRVMTIFHLASFERERHLTIVCDGIGRKLLGNVSSTYTVAPSGDGSRLVLKLVCNPPGGSQTSFKIRRDPSPAGTTRYVLETSPRSFLPIPSQTIVRWRSGSNEARWKMVMIRCPTSRWSRPGISSRGLRRPRLSRRSYE